MSFHEQELQHDATPDEPDPIHARHLQEVLGGQYGEISVAVQYGFRSWNSKLPGTYRDMLYGLGAEESGHVEMLAIMIAELLETAPVEATEDAMEDPTPAAVIGGDDIQHAIVAGAGARPVDSSGNPWQGSFVTASGDRHPTERTA
jgi:Mn-containing catalase